LGFISIKAISRENHRVEELIFGFTENLKSIGSVN